MDKTLTKRFPAPARGGRPIVAFANWFQFGPGEKAVRPRVESRMLLWCVSGKGELRANGRELDFIPGSWVFLPWHHEIFYAADARAPFFVGGIHLIPWHADKAPVVFQIAHQASDTLAEHPSRRDARWPKMDQVLTGHFAGENDRLALLATYIVERFQQGPSEREGMHTLAGLLVQELRRTLASGTFSAKPRPAGLFQMQHYARTHLDRLLEVEELAQVAGCSPATVHRLFRAFESQTPGRWMARMRAERAAFLLRTTRLSVRHVGEQVGLPDPFHFSRFFKRETGSSPRAYQQSRRFL